MMAPRVDSHVPCKRPRLSSTDKLANERLRLPIAEARQALVSQLRRLDTAIVVGETGSGKSTQVPQYLLDHVLPRGGPGCRGVVCVSQPRRVAAIALASRVSSERDSVLGAQVGYSVRFERALSPGTRLCFCTDGVLCREAISDPRLARYDVLVLDEVHERALHTDVALALARRAQGARRGTHTPLKLVVMTATPDVLRLRRYLDGAPVLFVRGRQRDLELRHVKSPQGDYLHATLVTIFQVHREEDRGDILVFLTGQDEIEATARICRQLSRVAVGNAGVQRIEVLPLYSALPPTVQQRVFSPVSPDCRKVVLATNIAETSLTIPGIRYVIDSGVVKIKRHNAELGAEVLAVGPVAQSQAAQRAGRAGRDGPGICFRLYTHKQFMALSPLATPEIQRCDLASVLLNLLAIGVPNVEDFDFMDRPSPDAIQASLQTLQWLGAVKRIETSTQGARGMQVDNGVRPSKLTNEEHSTINGMVVKTDDSKNNQKKIVLTTLGRTLAAFPLDPQLAKALLAGSELSCLEEMLTFAAVLSVDSFFLTSAGRSKEGDQAATACLRFTSPDGDAPTLAAVFRAYLASGSNKAWCIENALNHRNLRLASEVRKQLRDICVKLGLKMSSSRNEPSLPLRALCRGLFLQAVRLRPDKKYESFATHRPVTLGPSSALRAVALRPVVLHHGLAAGGSAGLSMRRATAVKSEWLGEALPAALAHRWMI